MRRILLTLVFALHLVSLAESVLAQAPARSGYELAWTDEFDGSSLDTSKWTAADTNITTNNSVQDYLPSQVTVDSGNLVITSDNVFSRDRFYRSGLVRSTALQKHGRWDIRAKLPTSKGMWPAIWLLSDEPWPSAGEIDIMENRGDEPTMTSSAFHYGSNSPYEHNFRYQNQSAIHDSQQVNYHAGFHQYSVEWDPEQIRFYVDDVHHWTVRDSDVDGFLTNNVGEMRLIINTAIGGDFLDNPDSSTVWPQRFEIDYVHAYTKSALGPTLTFDNGGFEERGGSLAQWTTFGNSIGNVSSGHEQTNGSDESLKLYGQFNGDENFSGIEQGLTVEEGQVLLASLDALIAEGDALGGSNEAFLKIDYYSETYGLFGSEDYISSDSILLANASTATGAWMLHELESLVPEGAVEARLAIVFAQRSNAGGSIFVDDVNFFVAVPEPGSVAMALFVIAGFATRRRRQFGSMQ